MITPLLEKLILEGKAKWKNFPGAYSALYTIQVPKGKYIVIESFSYCLPETVFDTFDLILTMESDKTKDNFFFGGGLKKTDRTLNMMSVHNSDVRLRFSQIGTLNAIDYSALPSEAKEPLPPLGYGITLPVQKNMAFDLGGEIYIPISQPYSTVPLTGGVLANRNEPFCNLNTVSALPAVLNPNEGLGFNLGYVIVNQPFTADLG
jgi:hypothetical protein